ncbi:MAG: DUF3604 domain-containing protein [Thermoanaerobaculia bacterium]
MKRTRLRIALVPVVVALAAALAAPALAQDTGTLDKEETAKLYKKPGYSPYAGRNYPTRVFFGDTHLHTALSLDARAFGNTLGPEEAYRFARGEEVTSATGQLARLSRPLDFLVVADHSEALGTMVEIAKGNPALLADPTAKRWHDMMKTGGETSVNAALEIIEGLSHGKLPAVMTNPKLGRSIWENYTAVSEKYNEPGRFTALIGYEWTSNNKGNNLHRVVIFRDGKAKADQIVPFSSLDSENPADLWKALDGYEQKSGGTVLAIPHNGNLSNGRMFALVDFMGNPLTRQYAETRARWEPLYEVTQIKGDGEAHKFLSPNDEFAGYEIWDRGNLTLGELKKPDMLQYEYAREGLKIGLKLEQQLGTNPYKFGMIGSTDSHTSLSTAEEENFFGKHSGKEPKAERWSKPIGCFNNQCVYGWEQAASGYAAVWATENTREALFDAMLRKEVYATTGPRMIVRFFGGWEFEAKDARTRVPAEAGYSKGVPMGGDLPPPSPSPNLGEGRGGGKVPTFLVAALKDPIGANLDRIQVVKGWMDGQGALQEKVYDVVWSDGRKPEADPALSPVEGGKLPPVGNTVDLATATWTNTIGDPELITVWRDPDFDPAQRAFYYARVIEIPTPRWTAYDAVRYGIKMDPKVPMITQERAYTSPIWYNPSK